MPPTEFETIDDVNGLEFLLENEYDLTESTIRGYKNGIKKFFAWRGADGGTARQPPRFILTDGSKDESQASGRWLATDAPADLEGWR